MPTLPRDAADPEARRASLERARETYRYDRSYADFNFAAEVPRADGFDLPYLAKAVENELMIASNRAASRLSGWLEQEWEQTKAQLRARYEAEGEIGAGALLRGEVPPGLEARVDPRHPVTLEDYRDMYPLLPDPRSMQVWREDWYFAWQRVAGCNPIALQGVRELPEHLPLASVQAQVDRVLGEDSLEAALAERRLYMVDFAGYERVPLGATDGRQKYMDAPLALFWRKPGGLLAPLAIQRGQQPGPQNPIYTPADGVAWDMAKLSVQIADANMQGVVSHFAYCHLVMEAVILATRRQLGEVHPLRVLFEPHFEYTLPVNEVARNSLVSPGGRQDRLQAGTLEGSTELALGSLARYAIDGIDPLTDFAARGVEDVEGLPDYPFRDDALSSWAPLLDFVRAYVQLYYADAAAVVGDGELQAWVRELQDPERARLHRVHAGERVETVEQLVMIVARFLYQCTIFHAAINYSSWDHLGYMPNMPGAGWAPGPSPDRQASEDALWAMMSPVDLGFELISLMYSISMRHNRLGEYPRGHFVDPRVAPLVARLQTELAAVEQEVTLRNDARPQVYPYLLPSNITASIHV